MFGTCVNAASSVASPTGPYLNMIPPLHGLTPWISHSNSAHRGKKHTAVQETLPVKSVSSVFY